jgi:hypothetical protein
MPYASINPLFMEITPSKFGQNQFTIQKLFSIQKFTIHPNENQAQMMGWYGVHSLYMITTISIKKI